MHSSWNHCYIFLANLS